MTEQAFYNQVLNGTAMKRLISRLIAHFGMGYTSHILDQVKTLGFHQATATSISLGIDDLLTISSKRWLVQDAEEQNSILEKQNNYGNIHAVEKLRQSIEIWHATSEYLRHEMNANFQMTDPYNPVYLMSFSGARGNASQIHQLVGMRGLMSDPQGQMIDLPIQSNLREGLSLTEYIISCYGARKGVIDTAIRTGDAGYLTRRLVEVVQHIIVRRKDCGTFQGISVSPQNGMTETIFVQTLTGRVLADDIYIGPRCIATRNQNIGIGLINQIITFRVQPIYIRSPFTCRSTSWICQLCYGRSPSHGDLVELGEAVGIIAGQSIGEPGTQLTLRTFHTGGVFTGGTAEHIRAPFQGIIKFNEDLVHPTRTRYGHPAFLCSIDFDVTIESRNIIHNLTIPSKSLILVKNNQYIQSEQVIAEISNGTSPFAFKETVEKHIFSESGGEMHWSTYVYHAPKHEDSNVYLLPKTSHLWILAGSPYGSSQVSFSLYKDQDQMNVDSFSIKGRDISDELLNTSATKDRKIHDYSRPTQIISNDRSNFIYPSVLEENSYLLAKKRRNRFIIPLKFKYKKKKYKKKKDKKLIPCFAIWREIPIRGILNKDSILAYFDDPRYRRRMSSSGMIEWGTIEIEDLIKDQGTEEFLEDHTLIEDQGTEEFLEDHILIEDQGTEGFLEDHILIEDQRTKEFLEDHILIEDQRTEEFLEDHMLVEDQGSEESPEDHTLIEDLEIPQHLTLIEYKGIKKSSRQYKRLVKYQKYQSLIEYQKTKELYPQYQPLIEDPETEETEEEFLERLEKGLLNESEEEFLEEIEKEFLEETEEESLEEAEEEFLEEAEEEFLEEAEEESLEEAEEESLEEAEEESLEEAEEEFLEETEEEFLEEAEEEFLEETEEEFIEKIEKEFLEKTEEEFLEDPTLIEDPGIDEFLEDLEDTETAEFLEDHTLIKDQRIEKSLQYQTLIEEILEDSTLIENQGTEEFLEDYTLIKDQGIEKSLEDQILIEDQGTEEFLEGYTLIEDQGIEEFLEDYTLIEDQGIEESLEDQTLIENQGTKESSSEYPRIDTFFFIPEEVHILPKSSLIRVENNSIIGVGTWLTLSKRSRVGGLVQVERTKKYIELKIFSGDIHFFEETDDISRDSDILISKEENNFKESQKSKDWICVQGITPIKKIKEKYFFSIRPVVTYELPDRMNMKLATLFSQDLLQERENLQLRVIHYWLYGSSKPIRIISLKSIQLVRTCLVLNWDQEKNSFIEEEVHASFVEVRTNDLIRDFIKMELIKSPISYTRKRYDRASSGWILDNRLNATNINPFYSKIKIQAFHQHKGRIVGTLLNPNKIYKSLIILSSSNCFQMDPNTLTKKRNPLFLYGYSVGPLGTIVPKIANFYSFYHLITHNEILLKKYLLLYNLKDTFLLFQLMKIFLLDIGNLNLNSCFILKPSLFRKTLQVFKVQIFQFYLIDRNKRSYLKYISKKVFQVLEVSKYCLIDENSKIYNPESCGGFILNPFNWNWCPFFHNDNCEETSTIIRLGQFLCENVCLFKDKSYVQKSGQIVIVNLDSLVIRSAKPYLVTSGATVHGDYGKILYEGDTLVTFLYEKSRSSDITQGLPKVEQMFEVRSIDSISTNLRSRIEGWNEHIPGIIGVPWSFLIGAELTIAQSRISLVNKIQKVYRSQGVQIHNRHIEMIVRQVTSRVLVSEDGMSNIFLPRELVGLLRAERVGRALDESIFYRAILLGITKASLNTQSFISEASFQETARVLAKAAVRGRIDWLKGLKENVVLGRLLPIGTGFQFKGFLRPLGQDKNLEEKKYIYIFKPEMRDIMLHHKEFICSDVTHNLDEANSYEI